MRERIRDDHAPGTALQAIIANGRCGAQRFCEIVRLDDARVLVCE